MRNSTTPATPISLPSLEFSLDCPAVSTFRPRNLRARMSGPSYRRRSVIRLSGMVASERKSTPFLTSSACAFSRADSRRTYAGTYQRLIRSQIGMNAMPTTETARKADPIQRT